MKYRPQMLVLVCLALAGLVWLDNRDFLGSLWPATPPAAPEAHQAKIDEHLTSPQRPAAAEHIPQPALGNPLVSVDKAALSNWVERPLFAPSRHRPFPQANSEFVAASKTPPSYAFIGVILNREKTVAILRSVSNGANLHVQVGDTLGGWKVDSVERTAITLVRENDPAQVIQFKQACAEASGKCP